MKASEEFLRDLERQKGSVTIAQLKRLSSVYKMPLAYFLLEKAPKDIVVPDAFRTVYSSEEEGLSPSVMLAVRQARYAQSVVQELQEGSIKYDFKAVTTQDNPETVAAHFREILDVTLERQRKWSNAAEALREWKDAVERVGIFVLQQSLAKDDVSAFCLADKEPYVLLLNSSEHANRRMFSLFHEIAHILLHQSGICSPHDLSRNSYKYVQIEKYCNQFAASLLVPIADFEANAIVRELRTMPFETWIPEYIRSLASQYRVSQEVIYRRLVYAGILDEATYEQKRAELIKGFEEYRKLPKKTAPIPQYRKIISKNGHAYSALVFDSLHANRITFADAAEYLGTNTRHIAAIEAHL
jgi:Zn-dependent peptidase ImmA (M78 family)